MATRILVISPFEGHPAWHGAIVRTQAIVKYLAAQHAVWLVCRPNAPPTHVQAVLNHPHPLVQLVNLPLFLKLWFLVRREKIDLILVSHFWAVFLGLPLALLTRRRIVLDEHNAEYVRFQRMGKPLWRLIWLLEYVSCHMASGILCVSDVDKENLVQGLRLPPDKVHIVPNGADVAGLQAPFTGRAAVRAKLDIGADDKMALFFGTLAYQSNVEAVDIIITELAPHIEARFVIAGLGGRLYASQRRDIPSNVLFVDYVPDIVPLIKSADVVIAPIQSGSGTRFKIIESAACGRVVIATSLGAEGLLREAFGEALIIADTWPAFRIALQKVLEKPTSWSPSTLFRQNYDWMMIFEQIAWDRW